MLCSPACARTERQGQWRIGQTNWPLANPTARQPTNRLDYKNGTSSTAPAAWAGTWTDY
jgi:hypothetical protein